MRRREALFITAAVAAMLSLAWLVGGWAQAVFP